MKLVRENLNEDFHKQNLENDYQKGQSFGKKKALELVQKYLPFIKGVDYVDRDDRDDPNVGYGEDENFSYYDVLDGEIPGSDELLTILIGVPVNEEFNSDNDVCVKFYYDSVAFVGDDSDDEYSNWLEPVSITSFDKEEWKKTIREIKKYIRGSF